MDSSRFLNSFSLVDEKECDSMAEGFESFDEFDDASILVTTYCDRISEEEYEMQGSTVTEQALNELIHFMEQNPDIYTDLLKKKKKDEIESSGVMSYFKVKMMGLLHGKDNPAIQVSDEEAKCKLAELKIGMKRAYDYSQKAKGTERTRQSKRIADKKKESAENLKEIKGLQPPSPPPVPVSMSTPRAPLRELNTDPIWKTPQSCIVKRHRRKNSTTSLNSIHDELLSCTPMKRLRSTQMPRSPGGTPVRRYKRFAGATELDNSVSSTTSESLHSALMRIMHTKFQNIRSPSPKGMLYNNCLSPRSNQTQFDFSP